MGGRTNRLLVAIAAGLALVVESAIAQERELTRDIDGPVIVWKDKNAQTEGYALIQTGAARRNPDVMFPLISCIVPKGTKAVMTGSPEPDDLIRSVIVMDGVWVGCRGVVSVDNLR